MQHLAFRKVRIHGEFILSDRPSMGLVLGSRSKANCSNSCEAFEDWTSHGWIISNVDLKSILKPPPHKTLIHFASTYRSSTIAPINLEILSYLIGCLLIRRSLTN